MIISKDNFDELFQEFQKYFRTFVVCGEHLERLMFHAYLGVILKDRFRIVRGGRNVISPRIHTFTIQQSGTGKGESYKSVLWALKAFTNLEQKPGEKEATYVEKYKIYDVTTATDASLVGSKTEKWNKENKIKEIVEEIGVLRLADVLYWDEGITLLTKTFFSEHISEILQMAMDEPGHVRKLLAGLNISFKTNVSVHAGSYLNDKVKDSIFEKGLLQRMLVSFKQHNEEEIMTLNEEKTKLVKLTDIGLVGRCRIELRDKVEEILNFKYLSQNIKFSNDSADYFAKRHKQFFIDHIALQFAGHTQEILRTFFNRLELYWIKIASHRAIMCQRIEVNNEDVNYAEQLMINHISSIKSLLSIVGRKEKDQQQERVSLIKNIIACKPNITQTELLENLKILKEKGRWNLGFNGTLNILNTMIKSEFIFETRGEKNSRCLDIQRPKS